MSMKSAPRDGRYVAVSTGGPSLSYAYFENGHWLAPLMIGKPELGVAIIHPVSWLPLQTPQR
jgi:hypothetical protein